VCRIPIHCGEFCAGPTGPPGPTTGVASFVGPFIQVISPSFGTSGQQKFQQAFAYYDTDYNVDAEFVTTVAGQVIGMSGCGLQLQMHWPKCLVPCGLLLKADCCTAHASAEYVRCKLDTPEEH